MVVAVNDDVAAAGDVDRQIEILRAGSGDFVLKEGDDPPRMLEAPSEGGDEAAGMSALLIEVRGESDELRVVTEPAE